MEDLERLEISTAAAKAYQQHGLYISQRLPFHELVNVAFVNITSDDPKKAYWQAYAYIRRLVLHGGKHNSRRDATTGNEDLRVRRVTDGITLDELIDIRDAIDNLPVEEQLMIGERFYEQLTYQQMADRHCVNCRGSVEFKMRSILRRLRRMLSR